MTDLSALIERVESGEERHLIGSQTSILSPAGRGLLRSIAAENRKRKRALRAIQESRNDR